MIGTRPAPPTTANATSARAITATAIIAVSIVAAAAHVSAAVIMHWQTNGSPMFPDARAYDWSSGVIAQAWHSGQHPGTQDLAAWSGSQLWGYPALMALAKLLTSGGWLAAKLLLSLVAATGAVAAYALVKTIGAGARRALGAGLAVALSPTLLLWDAWGLKDGLIIALVLWTLLVQARTPLWLAGLATLLAIEACLYLRPATALFLSVALVARLRPRPTHLVGALIAAAGIAIVVLPRLTALFRLVGTLEVQDGTALAFNGGYGSHNLVQHPQYLIDFVFGPFPWDFGPASAGPERWLYPGTALWIASLALAPAALRRAWRDADGVGRPAVLACCAYAVAYLDTFGATFYRQRSLLECVLGLLIVAYFPLAPLAALKRVQSWLGLVACMAALQSAGLAPTWTSKALFLCAVTVFLLLAAFPQTLPTHPLASRILRRLRPSRVR